MYLSIYPSIYLSFFLSIYLIYIYISLSLSSNYLSIYLSIYLSLSLSLSRYLAISLSVCLSVCLSIYLSIHLSIYLQDQKRSNSARLLQFLNLTTSKTKQFCETSFKNGKLSAALTALYQFVVRFFHSTCRKYCACHEKWMPGHTKCCTCHAKSF